MLVVIDGNMQFESHCVGCNRCKRNCSILQKAKEGRIQEDINNFQCKNSKIYIGKFSHKETISMPIKEYHADNHLCPVCGEEMVREVASLVCGCSVDKTGDFYRSIN